MSVNLIIDMISINVIASFILILGLGLRYWVNRRKFNRRNFNGVEGFKSYEHKTSARFIDQLLKLIARLLILGGAILFFMIWGW